METPETPKTKEFDKKSWLLDFVGMSEAEAESRQPTVSLEDESKLAYFLAVTLERVSAGTFAKPNGPPLCIIAFSSGVNLLLFNSPANWFTDRFSEPRRRRFHRYLCALVDFVTRYKTSPQIERMSDWKHCRCDCSDPVVRRCHLGTQSSLASLPHVVRVTQIAMLAVLQSLRLKTLDKPSESHKWPRQSSDITVGDASDTIKATKQWLKYTNSLSINFSCLTEQMFILPSLMIAVLRDADLLKQAITHLEVSARYACFTDPSLTARDCMFTLPNPTSVLRVMLRFHACLLDSTQANEYKRAYAPLSRRFYEICLLVHLNLSHEPEHWLVVELASKLALDLHSFIIPDHQLPALHPKLLAFGEEYLSKAPFDSLYGSLVSLYFSHRCSNPGCHNTTENMHRPLLRCSNCKFVKYCSVNCQSIAWKKAEAPHKQLCKLAARVAVGFPSMKDKAEMVTFTAQDFEERAIAAGITDEDVKKVSEQIDRLDTAMGMTP